MRLGNWRVECVKAGGAVVNIQSSQPGLRTPNPSTTEVCGFYVASAARHDLRGHIYTYILHIHKQKGTWQGKFVKEGGQAVTAMHFNALQVERGFVQPL